MAESSLRSVPFYFCSATSEDRSHLYEKHHSAVCLGSLDRLAANLSLPGADIRQAHELLQRPSGCCNTPRVVNFHIFCRAAHNSRHQAPADQ